jgi:hypothetical protein
MNSPLIVIGVLVVIAVVVVLGMLVILAKKKLQGEAHAIIQDAWRHAEKQDNPTLKIVEADKVLDEALKLLGYSGTLGDKLKKAGPRFTNLNDVWKAHKLRNTLVHELQKKPHESEVKFAMSAFKKALHDLGMK